MFEKIKKFYIMGLYTKEQVHKFFEKGVITEEEYKSILNAAGWLEKGVLEEVDLEEIQTAINGQYKESEE